MINSIEVIHHNYVTCQLILILIICCLLTIYYNGGIIHNNNNNSNNKKKYVLDEFMLSCASAPLNSLLFAPAIVSSA